MYRKSCNSSNGFYEIKVVGYLINKNEISQFALRVLKVYWIICNPLGVPALTIAVSKILGEASGFYIKYL